MFISIDAGKIGKFMRKYSFFRGFGPVVEGSPNLGPLSVPHHAPKSDRPALITLVEEPVGEDQAVLGLYLVGGYS